MTAGRINRLIIVVILGALLAGACNPAPPAVTPQIPTSPTPENTVPSASPSPEPSPTEEVPAVILYAPQSADPDLTAALQTELSALAAESGLGFSQAASLSADDITDPVQLVVALPPAEDLSDLAAAAPDTRFLALGFSVLPQADNLVQLGAQAAPVDQQAFLAGYLAAVVTPEWRVGVIHNPGSTAGRAFRNGVVYFCGLCRPSAPPYDEYPLISELEASAGEAEMQAAVDALTVRGVKTIYVAPGVDQEGIYGYIAQAGVNIIGSVAPPAEAEDRWIASIQADWLPAALEIIPGLLQGQVEDVSVSTLALTHRNPDLFSPGRQALVEKLLLDLTGGYIDTGVGQAATGE